MGIPWEYEPVELPWVPVVKIKYYRPDFRLTLPNGKTCYLETKGYFTPPDREKMIQIKRQYPSLDIRMFFMNENVKASSTLDYKGWAAKFGYKLLNFELLKNLLTKKPKKNKKAKDE